MKQMWNKCRTLVASFVLEILLPLLFAVIFFGIIDFSLLTSSANADLAQVFGQVRTNRYIFDLIASMQNVLSLIAILFVELTRCVKCFRISNFNTIKVNAWYDDNELFVNDYKENVFDKANCIYLRI